jgi:predicted lysophospholipase L1 biosynthesis ABC-type transport system permease subunit
MQPDVFVPMVNGPALEGVNFLEQRRNWHVFAIVRLKVGVTLPQALALGRMLILLVSGSVIGILLGFAASQVLSAIVYQASAQDPIVLGAVGLTVLLTGSLSVAGPVRRALRVDPAQLLREE